jgi:hypothetical protein
LNKEKTIKILKGMGIAIWISIPFVLLFLRADQFDHGLTVCPSKYFLNRDCPGCGLTRATMHILHFDFVNAWAFNKLSFFIFPFLVMIYFHVVGRYFGKNWFGFLRSYYSSGKKKKSVEGK